MHHAVPAMPITSDPDVFRQIYETKPTPVTGAAKSTPNRRKNNYANEFRKRAFSGNRRLAICLGEILRDQFGDDNTRLVTSLFDHFKSTANWRELAMIYRGDRYINCDNISTEILQGIPTKKSDKIWADGWEAIWDGIFEERVLFNDNLDGIYSVLESIVALRYQPLS